MKWRCHDGRVLYIREMGSQHIVNSLHMMQRVQRIHLMQGSLSALAYAGSAPDGAAMAAEGEADHMMDQALDPASCFNVLLAESEVAREMHATLKSWGVSFNVTKWSEP
jgi:hypothetical protein